MNENIFARTDDFCFTVIKLFHLQQFILKNITTCVIKSWRITESPTDEEKTYINITIRKGGLIAWVLHLMKIEPVTQINVTEKHFIFEEGSLGGSRKQVIPLQNISSSFYGYSKPWKEAIVFGVIVGILTFFLAFIPGIIAGILYYFLNKNMILGATKISGKDYSIQFKRSVIENQKIDESQAEYVSTKIQQLIDAKQS